MTCLLDKPAVPRPLEPRHRARRAGVEPRATSPALASQWSLTSKRPVARAWWLVILPARQLGVEVQAIINTVIRRLVWSATLAAILFLVLNIAGLPVRPGVDLYYASLLCTLLVGFVLFADVAVGDK